MTGQVIVGASDQSSLTMSSREIADLVNSRHDSVKRTIERLATPKDDRPAVIQLPPLVEVPNEQGQRVMEYLVGKRDSYVIVAQLCPEFTARLVDRWQELEEAARKQFNIPTTLSSALRLAAEQAEVIEQQTRQIEAAKPAVEFVDRYVESNGSKTFRQVCKLLKANEARFREFLQSKKIMYKLGGEWVPYADHLDAGRFEVKAGTSETSNHAYSQTRFTPKGVTWIAGEWAKYQLEQCGEVA